MWIHVYLIPSNLLAVKVRKSVSSPMQSKEPTIGNGKICYLQIPAADIKKSADFYKAAFGWNIRHRTDGVTAFDDGVGEVSGAWVLNRPPSTTVGVLTYIMVDDIHATIELILANGGAIVQPIGGDAPEITARFSDPYGNVFGVYQQGE